jgi:hypothetical protein
MIDCLRAASNDQYSSNNIQDIIPTLTWKLMENADLVELCHGRAAFGKLMQVVRKLQTNGQKEFNCHCSKDCLRFKLSDQRRTAGYEKYCVDMEIAYLITLGDERR